MASGGCECPERSCEVTRGAGAHVAPPHPLFSPKPALLQAAGREVRAEALVWALGCRLRVDSCCVQGGSSDFFFFFET